MGRVIVSPPAPVGASTARAVITARGAAVAAHTAVMTTYLVLLLEHFYASGGSRWYTPTVLRYSQRTAPLLNNSGSTPAGSGSAGD